MESNLESTSEELAKELADSKARRRFSTESNLESISEELTKELADSKARRRFSTESNLELESRYDQLAKDIANSKARRRFSMEQKEREKIINKSVEQQRKEIILFLYLFLISSLGIFYNWFVITKYLDIKKNPNNYINKYISKNVYLFSVTQLCINILNIILLIIIASSKWVLNKQITINKAVYFIFLLIGVLNIICCSIGIIEIEIKTISISIMTIMVLLLCIQIVFLFIKNS